MKKIIILALVVFLYVENGFSQSNYREGFIVKVSGDTLSGFIDYKGNLKKSEKLKIQKYCG